MSKKQLDPKAERELMLWSRFDDACAQVRKCLSAQQGGSKAEQMFSDAYQNLVNAGLAMQIRERMR